MGDEMPQIGKPDIQILLQDLAEARRDVHEERRNSSRVVAAERERARWEIERVRKESDEKLRSFEKENEALSRALGRLQGDNDRLREENAILRTLKPAASVIQEPPVEKEQASTQEAPRPIPGAGGQVGVGPISSAIKVPVIPPAAPFLGKVPMRPESSPTPPTDPV